MANQPNNTNSDEIDLGQLFQLIRRGFQKLFTAFLRLFLYFKRNVLILFGLLILGVGAGFGLDQILTKKLKTDVIVKPQMESKNYLYDVVDEIQGNIKAKNFNFFKEIGIELDDLKGLKIDIKPIDDDKESSENEIRFLELLQSFENTDAVADIVRGELQNKTSFNHRITFYYKDVKKGKFFSEKVMAYINSNTYFDGLIEIYRKNATSRIEENKTLLEQVDQLISNYADQMTQKDAISGTDRIVLDNQERVNITGLFSLKNNLIRDIESKNLELNQRTDAIKVINFGKPQEVQKTVFKNSKVLIPSLLLSGFFLFSFLAYLDKKAKDLV